MHALKVLSKIISIYGNDGEKGIDYIPELIIRCLVSIAPLPDDPNQTHALITLCELCKLCYKFIGINKPDLAFKCGSVKVILDSIWDIPKSYVKHIIDLILCILDKPSSRKYIRSGLDIEVNHIIYS